MVLDIILEVIDDFIMELIFDIIDEKTKKYKKAIRRTILTILPLSMFCFFIAIPILGETGGKSVLGLVLISILPVLLLVLLVMFIISKFKKK